MSFAFVVVVYYGDCHFEIWVNPIHCLIMDRRINIQSRGWYIYVYIVNYTLHFLGGGGGGEGEVLVTTK